MTSSQDHVDYLADIAEAMAKAQQFVSGMSFEAFAMDDKTVFAVIRALEIVGEAAKRIPDSFRDQYPEIPWRSMAGMRDKSVYGYSGINLKVVWKTVTEELPPLEGSILRVLADQRD